MAEFDLSRFETLGEVFDHHIERAQLLASDAKERRKRVADEGIIPGTCIKLSHGWNNPYRMDGLFQEDDRISVMNPNPTGISNLLRHDLRGVKLFTLRRIYSSEGDYRDSKPPHGHSLLTYRDNDVLQSSASTAMVSLWPDAPIGWVGTSFQLEPRRDIEDTLRIIPGSTQVIGDLFLPRATELGKMSPEEQKELGRLASSATDTLDVVEQLLGGECLEDVREAYPGVIPPFYILRD